MSERFTRVVGRAGTIAVKGKEYVIDEPGFVGEMVIVHYDPESETGERQGLISFVLKELETCCHVDGVSYLLRYRIDTASPDEGNDTCGDDDGAEYGHEGLSYEEREGKENHGRHDIADR